MLIHDIDAPPAVPPPVRGSLVLPAVPPPGSVAVTGGTVFAIVGIEVAALAVTDGPGVPVGLAVSVAPGVAVLVTGVFVGWSVPVGVDVGIGVSVGASACTMTLPDMPAPPGAPWTWQ
jgi:hypothetical protein